MYEHLSSIEKEDEVVLIHKSKPNVRNSWSWSFITIGFLLFLLSFFAESTFFMSLFTLIIIGSALGFKLDNKVKNKLFITIYPQRIIIEHKSNRKKIPSKHTIYGKDIKRVFVTYSRKKSFIKNKNDSVEKLFYYEIWAEKNNGQKIRILGKKDGFFSESQKDTQIIMEKMQTFLQQNKYVEHTTAISPVSIAEPKILKPNISKRKLNKEIEIHKMTIKDLQKGVLVDYYNDTWEVIGQAQYDWKRGNTHVLYQLQNSKNVISLLLVCQEMAIYTTWLEHRLSYHELAKNELDKVRNELLLELTFQGKVFLKEEMSLGYEFVGDNPAVKIKEWKYISEDKTSSLRILEHEHEDIFVFSGERIESYEFSNILLC